MSNTKASSKNLPWSTKISILSLMFAITLGYSVVSKKEIERVTNNENQLILKKLPSFQLKEFKKDFVVNPETMFRNGAKLAFVHFWGTWCAPCEAELPDFIEFLKSQKGKGINGILLSVNDKDPLITKFMKRFGELPDNIILAHNEDGSLLSEFGTVKVPETYLFRKDGKTLNKYVGAQDWNHRSFGQRMEFYLNSMGKNVQK
ncbi:TlpA disulfide reductase family protein [Bacteriovoracaceae bacterium]|nr:TlpA disulfide reductase family protein [Bacteriovoracaceae bacterium]|tara:strand:+ start:14371 stop:14979 length:609 start_codon:yes stop_codon:yes gene_type:complete